MNARSRLPSRPDPRLDPDSTPPDGTDVPDELERARGGREHAPWWAHLIFRKLDVDEQFRRHGARLGEVERVTQAWEDAQSNTQIRNREAEKEQRKARERRHDRLWTLAIAVAGPLLVLLILTAIGWVHIGPPAHPTPIEVKP